MEARQPDRPDEEPPGRHHLERYQMADDVANLPASTQARRIPLLVGQRLELVRQTGTARCDRLEQLVLRHGGQDTAPDPQPGRTASEFVASR